jgi:NAD(P)-dependent dehydrogenase (short-subunit alcohol dehydrogenase family)
MPLKIPHLVDALLECSVAGSFSRAGYETRSRLEHWKPLSDYDMTSQNVVITGPTSGIGREVARTIRAANANVILVARNREKLNALVDEINSIAGTGNVSSVVADIGDLAAVRSACDEITGSHTSINVLIHNAGALSKAYLQTAEGIESTVASQVVGPFLMTSLLMPLLRLSRGRVITVSSGGMYAVSLPHVRQGGSIEMSSSKYDGTRQYALAKRAQVTLNEMWGTTEPDVQFHAMHPGWADTPGVQEALPAFRKATKAVLRTPAQGADTIAWLAMEQQLPGASGSFWCDRSVRSLHRLPTTKRSDTQSARDALWEWCVDASGVSTSSR